MNNLSNFQYGDVLVIKICNRGTKNHDGHERLRDDLLELVSSTPHGKIILDLAEQPVVNSTFISALLAVNRRCGEEGSTLKLSDVSPELREVLSVMHLDKLFESYPSQDEALASFR